MINSSAVKYTELIKQRLYYYVKNCESSSKKLIESILYSLLPGGKFLRSLLTIEFCKLCNGSLESALPLACSVEMIHTYSLIHDDLPCMDNDFMRRGKPSNHVVNGEDFAVLAGDALLSLAIEILTLDSTLNVLGAKKSFSAIKTLINSCGVSGMVDGQALDIEYKNDRPSIFLKENFILKEIYLKKTGKLFGAACALGCIAAGANDEKINIAKKFGQTIGVIYQTLDDLEDKELNNENIKSSKFMLKELINKAMDLLSAFNDVKGNYSIHLISELKLKANKF